MLILNVRDVQRCLPMPEAIAGMKHAFTALHQGQVVLPPRTHMPVEDQNAVSLIMPSYVCGHEPALAVKVVGIFPNNLLRGVDRILGAVMVFDPETGAPLAVLEGASMTGIRTAAVSGAATDLLARDSSRTLAIIGAGVQARTHISAMCAIRSIERVFVFSRTRSKTESLVEEMSQVESLPPIEITESADEAVSQADIVCCTTSSGEAVFSDVSVKPGTHINAVGSSQTTAGEVPAQTVARAKVVVDQREAAFEEAGDILKPIASGLITKNHVLAALGELTSGHVTPIRTQEDDITFFKSVGLAMQDAVAATICLKNAKREGIGQQVDW